MDVRWDPPDPTSQAAPAIQGARHVQKRPAPVPQIPHSLALPEATGTLNPWDPQNLDLITKKITQQQPSEAARRYTPSSYTPPTPAALPTLNIQSPDSSSGTNTQQQQPTARRSYFITPFCKKSQRYLRGLQATVKAHYQAFIISAQQNLPSPLRGRMPGGWPEDFINTEDSTTANQTLNIHSGQLVDDSMGTSASQNDSELARRQNPPISPKEEGTAPRPSDIGRTSLLPKSNIAGVGGAMPQPDHLTNDRQSTMEREWPTIVNSASAFTNKPRAPRQAHSTTTQKATFIDSIDTDSEYDHTFRTPPNVDVKEFGAALSGLDTVAANPGQHIRDQDPPSLPLPEKYTVPKAMQEHSQLGNKPYSKLSRVPDAPTMGSSGPQHQGHSTFTYGHQIEGSKSHLRSTDGKPAAASKLPLPQSNENTKGSNLYFQKHNTMIDRPGSGTMPVLEEQATNSSATQTMIQKQPQGFGNSGSRKSAKVPRALEPTPKPPGDLPTCDFQENNPRQAKCNNDHLLDPGSLNSGAPMPEIRNPQARIPDLGPPPPLPVPIKFQAAKQKNESSGAPVAPSRAVTKPYSNTSTQASVAGSGGPSPATVTAGPQATASTQSKPKSQITDRKSLVTISAEFNPRLEVSTIPRALTFTHETGNKEHKTDAIIPGKSKRGCHFSGTPPSLAPGELKSDIETNFKELALTPHDWEEIEAQGRAQGNLSEQDLKWIKIFNKLQDKANPRTDQAHDSSSDQPGTNVKEGEGDEKKSKKAKKKAKKNKQKAVEDGKSDRGLKVYPNPTFQFGKGVGMDPGASPADYIVLPGEAPEVRSEYLREIVAVRPTLQTTQPPAPGHPVPRLRTLNPNPVIIMPGPYNTAQPSTSVASASTNSGQSAKLIETASIVSERKLHSFPPFPEPVTYTFNSVEGPKQIPITKAAAHHPAPPPRQVETDKRGQVGPSVTNPSSSHPPLTSSKARTSSVQVVELPGQSNLPAPPIPERFRVTNVANRTAQLNLNNSSPKPDAWQEGQMATYIIGCLEKELMQDHVEAQYVTRLKRLAADRPLKTIADGSAFKSYIKKYIEAYITSRVVRIFHEFQGRSFLTEELKDKLQRLADQAIPVRQNESERLVEQFLNTFVVLMPTAPTVVRAPGGLTQASVQAPQKESKKSAFTENLDSKLKVMPAIEKDSKSTSNVRGTPAAQAKPTFNFTTGSTNKPTQADTTPAYRNNLKQEPIARGKQSTSRKPETKGKQPVSRNSQAPTRATWSPDTSDDEPLECLFTELQGTLRGRDVQFLLSTVKSDVGYTDYLEGLANEIGEEGSSWPLRPKEEMAQLAKGLTYCPKAPVIEKKQDILQITGKADIKFQKPNPYPCVQQVQNTHSALKPPFFKKEANDEWAYERMYSDEYFHILNKMNPAAQQKPDEKVLFEKVRLGKRKTEIKDSGCGVVSCTGCQACPGQNTSTKRHPRAQALISMSNGDTILVETFVDNLKDMETFTLNPVSSSTRKGLREGGMPFKPFKSDDSIGCSLDNSTQTERGGFKGGDDGTSDEEVLSEEKEEALVNSALAEMEKGIRAKQENLIAELEKFKAEQEKTLAALEALTGGVGNEQAPVVGSANEKAPGAGPPKDKSGSKKKKKKGKK